MLMTGDLHLPDTLALRLWKGILQRTLEARSTCRFDGGTSRRADEVAYAIHNFMIVLLKTEATEICEAWGIGRFDFPNEPRIFNFDVFEQAKWERLAELAGEPVDVKAWQAWARERGTSLADTS